MFHIPVTSVVHAVDAHSDIAIQRTFKGLRIVPRYVLSTARHDQDTTILEYAISHSEFAGRNVDGAWSEPSWTARPEQSASARPDWDCEKRAGERPAS